MDNPENHLERRSDIALRDAVEMAIRIGKQNGFVAAADFMHAAHIPVEISFRLLACIDSDQYRSKR